MLRSVIYLFLGLVLFLSACSGSKAVTYKATLLGANEKPSPVVSPATGSATAVLNGKKLTVTGNFQNLSSDVTMAHVHRVSAADGTGGVVFALEITSSDKRGGGLSGSGSLSDADVELLQGGKFYINVHSNNFASGEIRGDLAK
ncbi:MAG: CHRD domain-containing protein [Deinococcales bacterium]